MLEKSSTKNDQGRTLHKRMAGAPRPKAHLMGPCKSWRAAMQHYVGLDVSLKLTAICIVCCIQPGGNRRIHQVACAACRTDRA
jgi:hypothetical protein